MLRTPMAAHACVDARKGPQLSLVSHPVPYKSGRTNMRWPLIIASSPCSHMKMIAPYTQVPVAQSRHTFMRAFPCACVRACVRECDVARNRQMRRTNGREEEEQHEGLPCLQHHAAEHAHAFRVPACEINPKTATALRTQGRPLRCSGTRTGAYRA